jgi:uncharacterized protein (UPF0216 family)
MPERRPPADDTVLMRWMRTEVNKINEGIVTERKSLAQLLQEEKPASRTKTGSEYFFNEEVLRLLKEKLPADLQYELRLPVIFFSNPSVPDSCYINDSHALHALQALGDLSGMRRMHQGKLWVGRAIAYSLMKKYPTAVQIAMG